MKLPNNLVIDVYKLSEYVLNPEHPEGRHKARVFLAALGITKTDANWLATIIREQIDDSDVFSQGSTPWGDLYRIDMEIVHGTRCAKVRTGWICSDGQARLTTCFVIGECNEAA